MSLITLLQSARIIPRIPFKLCFLFLIKLLANYQFTLFITPTFIHVYPLLEGVWLFPFRMNYSVALLNNVHLLKLITICVTFYINMQHIKAKAAETKGKPPTVIFKTEVYCFTASSKCSPSNRLTE